MSSGEEFWQWFGASRIVNPDGSPRVVFHGTGVAFDEFDAQHVGQNFGVDAEGFFFTTNTRYHSSLIRGVEELYEDPFSAGAYAKHAARRVGGAPNVMPAYLRIENPLTLEDLVFAYGYRDIANMLDDGHPQNFLDDHKKDIIWMMRVEGRDGLALEYGNDNVFMVLDPAQIRSALLYPDLRPIQTPERKVRPQRL